MKIREIAYTCYPVTDMGKAREFYEGILGLMPTMDHEGEGFHWVEYDIGAATLALGFGEGMTPSSEGCNVGLEVDDFDSAIAELKEANVEFSFGPMETPVCHMAYVRDPDGNAVGVHKRKEGHG
ncbi:VOC family protein [Puniceicoccaceae bacterium K14]|nr:VOC family protein [Puniceicoccaceae bacterium K14]